MTWVFPGRGSIEGRLDPPKSIRLFTALFWASLAVGIAADIFFWDETMRDFVDGEISGPAEMFGMQLLLAGSLAALYTILGLLWFFIAEKRSRFAKWFYVLLLAPYAFGLVIGFEEYAMGEFAIYGISTMLFVASACFLFTPEARNWFAGKIQIDPSVFE